MSESVAIPADRRSAELAAVDEGARPEGPLHSLLFPGSIQTGPVLAQEQPSYFRDLNLDQLIAALPTSAQDAARIGAVFCSTLSLLDVVNYRQGVFRDLESPELQKAAKAFQQQVDDVERHLAAPGKRHDPRERQAWHLDAALIYCQAVDQLDDALSSCSPRSDGLATLGERISRYRKSDTFHQLLADATHTRDVLWQITYCVRVRSGSVEVSRYRGQGDYSEEVEETFRRFRQGEVTDYRVTYRTPPFLGHVGAKILESVSRLYPEEFARLERFCQRHPDFVTDQVRQFDFELGFYLAYLEYIEPLRAAGLAFCYPDVTSGPTGMAAEDTFDIVLAHKLVAEDAEVVSNTFRLEGSERIFVVSGPNQGGKTTFARTFGQLHHLAALGCPVPGTWGALGIFDQLFTHFQREEELSDLRGKLEADLLRMHAILERATDCSIVIMNETFASTTLDDARFLGAKVMERMIARQVRAVYVTFVDELASFAPQVVSLVSTVATEDPARRTFRIIRAPANGLAYAMAIAEKYGVTYDQLKQELDR